MNGVAALPELVYAVEGKGLDLRTALEQTGFNLAGGPSPEAEVNRGCYVSARNGMAGCGVANAVLISVAPPKPQTGGRHR